MSSTKTSDKFRAVYSYMHPHFELFMLDISLFWRLQNQCHRTKLQFIRFYDTEKFLKNLCIKFLPVNDDIDKAKELRIPHDHHFSSRKIFYVKSFFLSTVMEKQQLRLLNCDKKYCNASCGALNILKKQLPGQTLTCPWR